VTDHREGNYPPELKAKLADDRCMICERLFGKHSQQEFERCMGEIAERTRNLQILRRDERG